MDNINNKGVNLRYNYKEGIISPKMYYQSLKKRKEADANISRDSPPLDSKEIPTFTPNMKVTSTTMHSSNLKGMASSYKEKEERQNLFTSPLNSDNSTSLYQRHARILNQKNEFSPDVDESLNDRMLSMEEYGDGEVYKTPSAMIRFKNKEKVDIL